MRKILECFFLVMQLYQGKYEYKIHLKILLIKSQLYIGYLKVYFLPRNESPNNLLHRLMFRPRNSKFTLRKSAISWWRIHKHHLAIFRICVGEAIDCHWFKVWPKDTMFWRVGTIKIIIASGRLISWYQKKRSARKYHTPSSDFQTVS